MKLCQVLRWIGNAIGELWKWVDAGMADFIAQTVFLTLASVLCISEWRHYVVGTKPEQIKAVIEKLQPAARKAAYGASLAEGDTQMTDLRARGASRLLKLNCIERAYPRLLERKARSCYVWCCSLLFPLVLLMSFGQATKLSFLLFGFLFPLFWTKQKVGCLHEKVERQLSDIRKIVSDIEQACSNQTTEGEPLSEIENLLKREASGAAPDAAAGKVSGQPEAGHKAHSPGIETP